MANENEENVESHVEEFDYEDLSAALDDFLEGSEESESTEDSDATVEEETHEEEATPLEKGNEELVHKEESSLGRKVASLNRRMENVATREELSQVLSAQREILDRLNKLGNTKEDEWGEEEQEEVNLNDPKQLDKYLTERERKRETERLAAEKENIVNYTRGYLDTMKDLLSEVEDKDLRKQIQLEMVKPDGEFNKRYSDVPERDCSKNFFKAMKSLQSKSVFDKKDRTPGVKTGVTKQGSTSSEANETLKYELDEYSEALVKKTGMSVKDINEALSNDAPMNLRRRA